MKISPYDVPEDLKLRVQHLRGPILGQRGGSPRLFNWITYADLVDEGGNLVATANSKCALMDTPCRKTGFKIAAGRVLARYAELTQTIPVRKNSPLRI